MQNPTIILDATRFILLAIVIGYAAWLDHKTGEVPNKVWVYMTIGLILTCIRGIANPQTILPSLLSIGATMFLAILLFYVKGWGGADGKAFLTIAVSLPITPFGIQTWTFMYPLIVVLVSSLLSVLGSLAQKKVPWFKRQVRFLPYVFISLFIALFL